MPDPDPATLWRRLTLSQQAALADMAVRPLNHVRGGWGDLERAHRSGPCHALVHRGLAEIIHHGTGMRITDAGRAVVAASKEKTK